MDKYNIYRWTLALYMLNNGSVNSTLWPEEQRDFWLKAADTYMANNSLQIIQDQAKWIEGDEWRENK